MVKIEMSINASAPLGAHVSFVDCSEMHKIEDNQIQMYYQVIFTPSAQLLLPSNDVGAILHSPLASAGIGQTRWGFRWGFGIA